jgi:hypothetical protein
VFGKANTCCNGNQKCDLLKHTSWDWFIAIARFIDLKEIQTCKSDALNTWSDEPR